MRKRNFLPFCDDLKVLGTTLSGDSSLKHVFTSQLPSNAKAGYCFETNTVLMPKINVHSLNEEEAMKFRVFHGHELLHHALTSHEVFKKVCDENKTVLRNFVNLLEDARIENNEHDRFRGWIAESQWYRGILFEEMKEKWDVLVSQNPFGAVMSALQFEIGGYGKFTIPAGIKKYYDIGIEILRDGRYEKSTHVKREGTKTIVTLAKEILAAWNQEKEEQEKQNGNGNSNNKTVEEEMKGVGDEAIINEDALKDFIDQFFKNRKVKKGNKAGKKVGKVVIVDSKDAPKDMEEEEKPESVAQMDELDYNFYFPLSTKDRTIVAKEYPQDYQKLVDLISNQIQFIRSYMVRYLRALSHTKNLTHLKKGKMDNKALHRLILGKSKRIYKKTYKGHDLSTAVQLVIDLSGSMSSGYDGLKRSELAAQVATLFGEIFEGLRLPFEIIGYNTSSGHRQSNVIGADRVSDIVNRWIFKEFKESYPLVRNRLGACSHGMSQYGYDDNSIAKGGAIGGCNVDHEVILWGAARLYRQKATRKVQIVLADGLPSGYGGTYGGLLPEELKKANKRVSRSGIEQFCFGIQCDRVKNYYPHHTILQKLEDLNIESMKVLAGFLAK